MTGAAKILRFNWPLYALAAALTVVGVAALRFGWLPGRWAVLGVAALVVGDFWLVASLAVSHWVYDRSAVARGAWLGDASGVRRAAVFHAGQDEASAIAMRSMPAAQVDVFDFYDPARNGSPSLERARALAGRRATPIAPDAIPAAAGAFDLGLVVFAAHEIRRAGERTAFLRELARVVTPAGRIVVVEHLRDAWNVLAFGPGALHFLSRRTWRSAFASAGLDLYRERSCTPFVCVFELRRAV